MPETKIQKAEDAYQVHQNIVVAKRNLTGSFLRLAYLLKIANDNKIHKRLGYETWEQYLATPEVSVSVSTASRLINIWKEFILKYHIETAELTRIDLSKLYEVLPVVRGLKSKKEVKDWLTKAKELGIQDLRIEKKEFLGGVDTENCEHSWTLIEYYRCSKCGLIVRHLDEKEKKNLEKKVDRET